MSFPYQAPYDFSQSPNNQNILSSQIPPYYFYFNPTNIVYEPFLFTKRIARLDFDMMGRVDVTQISRNGDIQSVMQLLSPIVFANITQVEATEFGSKGALHSFMILQMAVEFYLNVVGKLTWEIAHLKQALKKHYKIPPDYDQRIKANYESQIQILKHDVEKRDMIIDNLSEKYSNVKRERDSLKAQVKTLKNRETIRVLRPKDFEIENDNFSEGELKLNPKNDSNTNSSSQLMEPQSSSKSRSPRYSSKPKQPSKMKIKPKTKQQSTKYQDLNTQSSIYPTYSEENKESFLSEYYDSSTSSSGWT